MGRHESGKNRVPAGRLWQFCKVIGVDVATIYDGLPFHILPPATDGVPGMEEEGRGAPALVGYPEAAVSQPMVQRIGAVARQLPEARQRTALAVIRALKLESED